MIGGGGGLWKVIDNVRNNKICVINTEPSNSQFNQYFKDLSISQPQDNHNVNYEAHAISFIKEYDTGAKYLVIATGILAPS